MNVHGIMFFFFITDVRKISIFIALLQSVCHKNKNAPNANDAHNTHNPNSLEELT